MKQMKVNGVLGTLFFIRQDLGSSYGSLVLIGYGQRGWIFGM